MSEHYYTENPSSKLIEKQFSFSIKDKTLHFKSVSGVFAFSEKVDKASQLLIKAFSPSGTDVLDLGCGYGAIGLFIKALFPDQKVLLSDINSRAIEYAALNARENNLEVELVKSDLFSNLPKAAFDDIVSNPPIAAGKKLNTELIHQSYEHLRPGGSLWLVAFHNKGGSTLRNIMSDRYGNVQDVVKSGGIRVYRSSRIE